MMSYGASALTKGVRNILIATVAVYVLQILPGSGIFLLEYGALIPSKVFGSAQVWRLITYIFLHDPHGPWHLAFNMLALWMFGLEIEQQWGTKRFVIFYVVSGVGAGLMSFIMWTVPIIGASGAVLALLTVYAIYFPYRKVLMFFIFPVPVRMAVAIIGVISLLGSMGSGGGIAHLTHLGGIVVALIYMKVLPLVAKALAQQERAAQEKKTRRTAEQRMDKQRFYNDVVDPILKKISQQGMQSLTKEEREILHKASRGAAKQSGKGKIIPFDFSK